MISADVVVQTALRKLEAKLREAKCPVKTEGLFEAIWALKEAWEQAKKEIDDNTRTEITSNTGQGKT